MSTMQCDVGHIFISKKPQKNTKKVVKSVKKWVKVGQMA